MSGRRPAASKASAAKSRARPSYHYGDLKSALIEAAVQLIDEKGVHDFSLAEASRRLGVAASAPYAHFADRDALLAAVAVHALELFEGELNSRLRRQPDAAGRLVAISGAYVRFAGKHETLFRTLFDGPLDKARHVEIAEAEQRIDRVFRLCVEEVVGVADEQSVESVAAAIEAIAHGYATLLLDGRFGRGRSALERAVDGAARSTAALIDGRTHLTSLAPSK
jgi:AcrR family transcriptional regulator